jgi:hypothetical protein
MSTRRAMYGPSSIQTHHQVGVLVFVETHRRILGGNFGRIPEALKEDAFSMGGYCLDAHDIIPAGSVAYESFGPEPDDWIWAPTHIERGGSQE